MEINRPEIKLYADQNKLLNHQSKIIKARNQPKANLFLQGGYGRPSLNLLKNEFNFLMSKEISVLKSLCSMIN